MNYQKNKMRYKKTNKFKPQLFKSIRLNRYKISLTCCISHFGLVTQFANWQPTDHPESSTSLSYVASITHVEGSDKTD